MYTLYLLTYCAMFPTARSKWIKRVLPSRYQIRIFVSNAITFIWFSDVGIGKKQLEIEWAFRVRIKKKSSESFVFVFLFCRGLGVATRSCCPATDERRWSLSNTSFFSLMVGDDNSSREPRFKPLCSYFLLLLLIDGLYLNIYWLEGTRSVSSQVHSWLATIFFFRLFSRLLDSCLHELT